MNTSNSLSGTSANNTRKHYIAPHTAVINIDGTIAILSGSGDDDPNADIDKEEWAEDSMG